MGKRHFLRGDVTIDIALFNILHGLRQDEQYSAPCIFCGLGVYVGF